MSPEPSNQPAKYQIYLRDLRAFDKPADMSSVMTAKSQFVPSEAGLNNNDDEILPPRRCGSTVGAVGSTQVDSRDKDGPSNRNSPIESSQDPDVAAKLEQKRLEHERQRNMKRELFEQQMQQLEIQQLQEEQAMLAGNKKNANSAASAAADLSQGLASIRSLPVSRRNSNDAADIWSEMDKLSLGDKPKRPVDLSKIGRSGTMKTETTSPSESAFSDSTHLSQFTERFIFDDDNSTPTTASSSSRLPSIPRSIWKDEQGLGVGSSAIGSTSYLPRYFQMGGDDDDTFPTMRSSSSSASDLSQIPHTPGLRHHSVHDLSRTSEWPQFSKVLPSSNERLPAVSQHGSGIIGFGGINKTEDSLKSPLPKLTPSYSSSEIPTRFNKPPALGPFDDLAVKAEANTSDVCTQFQQGYCPRGDLCPYAHAHVLPSTSRPSSAMPLSPSLTMSVGGLSNSSASFYSSNRASGTANAVHTG
ncbi:hypothetical protein BGZ65_008202, partial [Modicella reniformis]